MQEVIGHPMWEERRRSLTKKLGVDLTSKQILISAFAACGARITLSTASGFRGSRV